MLPSVAGGLAYETSIDDRGERGQPAVVLIHGTPLDRRCWEALVPALAGAWRVISYDVRGHGTAAESAIPGSYEVLADDVLALLDRLALARAHIVGHSLGGQIAQEFALRHASRCASLTVLCARATPYPPFADVAASIRAGGVAALAEPTLARWFTAAALSNDADDREKTVIAYVRACLQRADADRYADALELIAGFDALERLRALRVPARFMAAERDPVSGPQPLQQSSLATPGGALVVFAGAGHMLPLEQPQLVGDALLTGLAALA